MGVVRGFKELMGEVGVEWFTVEDAADFFDLSPSRSSVILRALANLGFLEIVSYSAGGGRFGKYSYRARDLHAIMSLNENNYPDYGIHGSTNDELKARIEAIRAVREAAAETGEPMDAMMAIDRVMAAEELAKSRENPYNGRGGRFINRSA